MLKQKATALIIAAMTSASMVSAPIVTTMGTVYAGTTESVESESHLVLSTTHRVIDTYVPTSFDDEEDDDYDYDDDYDHNDDDDYDYDDDRVENPQLIVELAPGCTSELYDAVSDDEDVVYAYIRYDDNTIGLSPERVGTATVTVTDENGETATLTVEVKRSYIYDEQCHYFPHNLSYQLMDIMYSNPQLYIDMDLEAFDEIPKDEITAYIDTPKGRCNLEYNEDGYPTMKVPLIPAGTKYTYYVQVADRPAVTGTSKIQKYPLEFDRGEGSSFWITSNAKAKNVVYNGKSQKSPVKVTTVYEEFYGPTKATLKNGVDYTVKYSNNKNVGTAKFTITPRGNYTVWGGSYTGTFKILPKSTSVKKLTKAKKSFKVTWNKRTAQTTGYQVQYSTSSKFSKAKTVTIKSNKTTAKTFKKLKAHKKYFVRVRTYKKVSGKNYYSTWSKTKSVKTN